MRKSRYTYFAIAHNQQGASVDVHNDYGHKLRSSNLREVMDTARSQLGKGWRVTVWGVKHDGLDGWFEPEVVKQFTIRK